jgi:hypothetical protein
MHDEGNKLATDECRGCNAASNGIYALCPGLAFKN